MQSRITQQPSPRLVQAANSRPGTMALSSTIEKLKGNLLGRPITVTPSKDSTSRVSPQQCQIASPQVYQQHQYANLRPESPPDLDDVKVVKIVRTPSPRKVLEVVSPRKAESPRKEMFNDSLAGLPKGISISRPGPKPDQVRKSPIKSDMSKNVDGVSSLGQEETSDITQPQRILDLLLSAGLTPHQPISILQRVSTLTRPVSDHQAKSTVQLLLDQVNQMRNLQSQLSVTHKQVLNLSPPLRRPSLDLIPNIPTPQDSQTYSTLLSLLSKLPTVQLLHLETKLTTSAQNTGVSPEQLLTQSNPEKSPSSTLEELSPTLVPPTRSVIPLSSRRPPPHPAVKTKAGSAGGGWRVWTGELGQVGSAWQLTVNPPKGQGLVKTFDVEKSYLRELGLENSRTKNLRTTDSEESFDEVKLFFGSKFLSVPKSVFQEEEDERISHMLN